MKFIALTQGKVATVDDDMFDELNQFKWFYHCGYARRNSKYIRGQPRHAIHMSRVVAKTPDGMQCDHISLNRCDNRRSNLRNATQSQNNCNKFAYRNNTTGSKGVDFHGRKFRARIQINGKSILLGLFNTLKEGEVAYLVASKMLHGDYGRTT